MLNKFIFEQTNLPLLQKGLYTYTVRQKASVYNIANAETTRTEEGGQGDEHDEG